MEENKNPKIDVMNRKKKKGGGFQAMGLTPAVFRAVMSKGYNLPTPIQRKAIPKIIAGQNIVATSRTGISLSYPNVCRKWKDGSICDTDNREIIRSFTDCRRTMCHSLSYPRTCSPNRQILKRVVEEHRFKSCSACGWSFIRRAV